MGFGFDARASKHKKKLAGNFLFYHSKYFISLTAIFSRPSQCISPRETLGLERPVYFVAPLPGYCYNLFLVKWLKKPTRSSIISKLLVFETPYGQH